MEESLLTTLPEPLPARLTIRVGKALKVAVIDLSVSIVRMQVAVPLHPPAHPAKTVPILGVAVNVTAVPELKEALQVDPQLMPEGELVTLPDPIF
jgi:hypothetical protein